MQLCKEKENSKAIIRVRPRFLRASFYNMSLMAFLLRASLTIISLSLLFLFFVFLYRLYIFLLSINFSTNRNDLFENLTIRCYIIPRCMRSNVNK